MYQLPGGAIEGEEDLIAAANRELSEESGYVANDSKVIGSFYINNRRSDSKQYVVLCQNLLPQKRAQDEEEFIESEWHTLDDVKSLIRQGEIENVNLLAAFTLLDSESIKRFGNY